MKDETQNTKQERVSSSIYVISELWPSPGRDISQYQYFINKWVILHWLALEYWWRRAINPRMPRSGCICQSQPELMTLPVSQSGPSTHSLLPKWPDLIKSIKTFVQRHTGAHREQPYRLTLRCLAAFLFRGNICWTIKNVYKFFSRENSYSVNHMHFKFLTYPLHFGKSFMVINYYY